MNIFKSKYKTGIINGDIILELEQQRNELLNLSISMAKELEKYHEMLPGYTSKEFAYSDDFEEATGESWEEIKKHNET